MYVNIQREEVFIIETWKDIYKYEGRYQISNLGRVKSFGRNNPMIMKEKDIRGYKSVTLHDGERKRTIQIHRLVAMHFMSNPDNKPQVNHKDGDKSNNCVENLEWVTNSENIKHAWENNLKSQEGEKNPSSVASESLVKKILQRGKYASYTQMSKDYGLGKSTIEHILKRHTWKHVEI